MKKIAVLMGGMSSEREVSLISGQGVLAALQSKGYDAFALDPVQPISGVVEALEQLKPDVVFNALHGKYGEDGCVQGLLNMMQIPYTHSGVVTSAISMDKQRTKAIVSEIGVDIAKGLLVTKEMLIEGVDIQKPYVVKPNDEGSSVGVFIVHTEADECAMLEEWPFEKPVLLEEYIPGRELSVAVIDEKPLGIVDIVPNVGFYDYKNKYSEGGAQHIIPANIPETLYETLMMQAYAIHKTLGCRGVSRSDFRWDEETGRAVFLEINVNPGMTPFSLVPEIAATKGINYQDLIELLIQKAVYEK